MLGCLCTRHNKYNQINKPIFSRLRHVQDHYRAGANPSPRQAAGERSTPANQQARLVEGRIQQIPQLTICCSISSHVMEPRQTHGAQTCVVNPEESADRLAAQWHNLLPRSPQRAQSSRRSPVRFRLTGLCYLSFTLSTPFPLPRRLHVYKGTQAHKKMRYSVCKKKQTLICCRRARSKSQGTVG